MFRDGPERLLVFRVGTERFGVALSAVREVLDSPAVSRIPDAAPSLLGVAMVRGELVPHYDARVVLDVGRAGDMPGAALLFAIGDRRVALAIDDVFDPVLVEEQELRPMPGAGAADVIICGLVRRGSDLIAVLDEAALLDTMVAAAGDTAGEREAMRYEI
jgi:purine-binding chemotaxis protein CheW